MVARTQPQPAVPLIFACVQQIPRVPEQGSIWHTFPNYADTVCAGKWQVTTMKSLVLLVEDEEALRLFIGDSLRNEGYAVEYACDGQNALEKGLRLPVELVILDIMLPHRDGFEVCKAPRGVLHRSLC
jgi:hypothetical protein